MDLPIPSHLRDIMIPVGESNSTFEVTGILRCSCGHDRFRVASAYDRLIVTVYCEKCGKEHLLFDAWKHGWDGFVCRGNIRQPEDPQPPIRETCRKCGSDLYRVKVWISSQGPDDFLEECVNNDPSFSAEDWVDAFEWITVGLTCADCGEAERDWLDLETM